MNFNSHVTNLASALTDNQKLSTKFLTLNLKTKIAQARSQFPSDKTLSMVDSILNKKQDLFVTASELTNWYHIFYTPSTKMAEVFKDELILNKPKETTVVKHASNPASYQEIMESASHPILANALSSIFNGEDKVSKSFDQTLGQLAEKLCNRELNKINIPAKKVVAFTGNSDLIICLASFETPKGETQLAFPVETPNNKTIFASVFLTEFGPIEANAKNLTQYLQKNAGKHQKINYGAILKAASQKEIKFTEISDIEKAALNIVLEKQTNQTNQTIKLASISNQPKSIEPEYLQFPKYKTDQSFSEIMNSPRAAAENLFGKNALNQADILINSCLKYANVNNGQIEILSHDKDSVTYGVITANQSEFKIPVKITNNQPQMPQVFICNGELEDFNTDNLFKASNTKIENRKIWAKLHADDNLTSAQLLDLVKEAAVAKDFNRAEEAIQILATRDEFEFYQEACKWHLKAMTQPTIEPEKSKCTMPIKSATTTQTLCGHTHLPLTKVFQDQFGQCVPIYRKSIAPDNLLPLILKAK